MILLLSQLHWECLKIVLPPCRSIIVCNLVHIAGLDRSFCGLHLRRAAGRIVQWRIATSCAPERMHQTSGKDKVYTPVFEVSHSI